MENLLIVIRVRVVVHLYWHFWCVSFCRVNSSWCATLEFPSLFRPWYFFQKLFWHTFVLTYVLTTVRKKWGPFFRSLEQVIWTVKCQNNFWQNAFLNCSWRFLISNKLEQLWFKLENNYCDLETCRKS